MNANMVRVAVEGCCHGDLDKIYATIEYAQKMEATKIDLLICCGDFQSVRNEKDLECLHVPENYREYKDFYKYYSGEKVAPIPTIFIGGNHEASNYLRELYYGGYVAPNIYYLGHTGVVNFKGLRIAGGSGIFKMHDYWKTREKETLPYTESSIRSAYHIRHFEIYKLYQLANSHVDIFLSHDWPSDITNYGDVENLLRWKKHFKQDIERGQLGSPASQKLLHTLRPSYWFSGHLHCKFAAVVKHENTDQMTKFLALDKCLPKRSFLQVLDIEPKGGMNVDEDDHFYHDLEWLAITRLTNAKMNSPSHTFGAKIEDLVTIDKDLIEQEKKLVLERLSSYNSGKYATLRISKDNFVRNAPVHDPTGQLALHNQQTAGWNYLEAKNPQTAEFLEALELPDLISFKVVAKPIIESKNEDEIELDL